MDYGSIGRIEGDIFSVKSNVSDCMTSTLQFCKKAIRDFITRELVKNTPGVQQLAESICINMCLRFTNDFSRGKLEAFIAENLSENFKNAKNFSTCIDTIFWGEANKLTDKLVPTHKTTVLNIPRYQVPDSDWDFWHGVFGEILSIPKTWPIEVDLLDEGWYQYLRIWIARVPSTVYGYVVRFKVNLEKTQDPWISLMLTNYQMRDILLYRLASCCGQPGSFVYLETDTHMLGLEEKTRYSSNAYYMNVLFPSAIRDMISYKKAGEKLSSFSALDAIWGNSSWHFDKTVFDFITKKAGRPSYISVPPPSYISVPPKLEGPQTAECDPEVLKSMGLSIEKCHKALVDVDRPTKPTVPFVKKSEKTTTSSNDNGGRFIDIYSS